MLRSYNSRSPFPCLLRGWEAAIPWSSGGFWDEFQAPVVIFSIPTWRRHLQLHGKDGKSVEKEVWKSLTALENARAKSNPTWMSFSSLKYPSGIFHPPEFNNPNFFFLADFPLSGMHFHKSGWFLEKSGKGENSRLPKIPGRSNLFGAAPIFL